MAPPLRRVRAGQWAKHVIHQAASASANLRSIDGESRAPARLLAADRIENHLLDGVGFVEIMARQLLVMDWWPSGGVLQGDQPLGRATNSEPSR